jgi:hypothetical protein
LISLISIALMMLSCGVLGGSINFFLLKEKQDSPLTCSQHALVGIGASFMVPLFLNMISSGLIDQVQGSATTPPDHSKLLVLAGFCLVAAISSRAFITSMSDRVLREVKEVKQEAAKAQEEAAEAKATMESLVERDDGEISDSGDSLSTTKTQPDLSADEKAVIGVMANSSFAMRSLSGISKQAEFDKTRANVAITSLMEKNLVAQGSSQKGYPRWFLTTAGRMHVKKI